jgi:hypothetical protein
MGGRGNILRILAHRKPPAPVSRRPRTRDLPFWVGHSLAGRSGAHEGAAGSGLTDQIRWTGHRCPGDPGIAHGQPASSEDRSEQAMASPLSLPFRDRDDALTPCVRIVVHAAQL